MIFCKELDKSFETKDELFKALKDNSDIILGAKKSVIYKGIDKGLQIETNQEEISKFLNEEVKGLKMDDDYYYFVVNSANILDSHNDMHVDGNWNKTVKEKQNKVYLVFDHKLERKEIIAMPKDIELLTAKIPFKSLGKNYEGETYSLIYKVRKDRIVDEQAKEWLDKGVDLQASVRMRYIKIESAFNINSPEYAKEKETFDTYFPLMANKDEHPDLDYFWVIKEAENVYESSLVLFGSNSATGRIDNKEQPKDTQTIEQAEATQEVKQNKVLIF